MSDVIRQMSIGGVMLDVSSDAFAKRLANRSSPVASRPTAPFVAWHARAVARSPGPISRPPRPVCCPSTTSRSTPSSVCTSAT